MISTTTMGVSRHLVSQLMKGLMLFVTWYLSTYFRRPAKQAPQICTRSEFSHVQHGQVHESRTCADRAM
jgi:hypothetical protein